ncbi:hypothetical protein V6N13_052934 [Hibiscus sabdariffa]|uniref:Uncharacterized protein n=1 Tax=Hibiscus sabdariffa TaxID=183260 RepID=A0ABR2Q5R6_9ROSI
MEAKEEVPVMQVESEDSSTEEAEVESPRSVVVKMKKKAERVHSQILRIREEDSRLGEVLIGRDKENENDVVVVVRGGFHEQRRRRVSVVLLSRPILPCSPLSGKNNVKPPSGKASPPSIDQGSVSFLCNLVLFLDLSVWMLGKLIFIY